MPKSTRRLRDAATTRRRRRGVDASPRRYNRAFVISRGADPNQLDLHGTSGIAICSNCAKPRQLQLLVDAGADVNKGRKKPLLYSCGSEVSRFHYRPDAGKAEWQSGMVDGLFEPDCAEVTVLLAAGADPLVCSRGKNLLEILRDRLNEATQALAREESACRRRPILANISELEKITDAVARARDRAIAENRVRDA